MIALALLEMNLLPWDVSKTHCWWDSGEVELEGVVPPYFLGSENASRFFALVTQDSSCSSGRAWKEAPPDLVLYVHTLPT